MSPSVSVVVGGMLIEAVGMFVSAVRRVATRWVLVTTRLVVVFEILELMRLIGEFGEDEYER
jgi:hypothetical protein